MYLPRPHTGNIFPSWTVVVRRHHVYVREFHRPSCNSVEMTLVKSLYRSDPDVIQKHTDLQGVS